MNIPETTTHAGSNAALLCSSHYHRCQSCGTIWGHGNMMQNDIEAHKCPKCATANWRIYSGRRFREVSVKQPQQTQLFALFLSPEFWLLVFAVSLVLTLAEIAFSRERK